MTRPPMESAVRARPAARAAGRGVARVFGLVLLAALAAPAWGFDDIAAHPACAICGMDRKEYAHSRMLIEYEDGTSYGLCSLRCAAFVLRAEDGRNPRSVKVADYGSRELVEAEEAHWAVGGTRPGVMTPLPKWAFRNRGDREKFQGAFGGWRATYREALREATKELE